MSYNISKVYTDQPLVDEVCFYCKTILKGIVVKNDVLAANNETENSLTNAEVYYLLHDNGYVSFEVFPFTKEILLAYGYTAYEATEILDNKYVVPEEDREALTDFANQYFIEHFEEENNYYRTLLGLPPYNTGEEYYIWLTEDDIPANYTGEYDLSKPLHEQNEYLITVLYSEGIIDKLREVYVGSNYTYMLFLGAKSIDLYTARKANKWDILYIPNVYYLVEDKFTEIYKINQEIYRNRSYQDYFAETGEYYDQMMILILLSQTFSDLMNEIPEWYIRRDVFDIKTCQSFLDSYGVDFFPIIPLKFQIRLIKNINNLIKYKSSNKNLFDIIDLFGIDGITIYKYWLYKKKIYKYDKYTGETELQFVASGVDESYDNYITNNRYILPYDDITYEDPYWDGMNTHAYVREQIKNLDFTIEPTKYMSIEYHIPLNDYVYQSTYLLGLFLRTEVNIEDIKIPVPSIDDNANFRITDLLLFLILLTNSFNKTSMDDRFTEARYVDIFNGSDDYTVNEEYYDWLKDKMPEIFVNRSGRINTFNPKADLNKLNEMLLRRNSHERFGLNADDINDLPYVEPEYSERAQEWIDAIGYNDFINPTGTYETIDDLLNVYYTNTELYNKMVELISNCDNSDDKHIYRAIFDELFTAEFDKDFYKIIDPSTGETKYVKDLIELLQYKDYILYKKFYSIISESKSESRQDMIRTVMNDVIATLEYYIKGDGLDYLYSFTSTESFSAIVYYIYLIITFFKSYKVHFLNPYVTYEFEDEPIKSAKPIDNINEYRIEDTESDYLAMRDHINFNKELLFEDAGYIDQEVVDIYAHYEPDPFADQDYNGYDAEHGEEDPNIEIDGKYASDENHEPYITVNGGPGFEGVTKESLHDINGGNASEIEYVNSDDYYVFSDIDGGYSYDPDDLKTDAWGSQCFTYDLDGSGASGKAFYTGTLHTFIIGTEILAHVIISPDERNRLIVKPDGLYFEDTLVPKVQFEEAKEDVSDLARYTEIVEARARTTIETIWYIYRNLEIYTASVRDTILYPMIYVNKEMENDKFANDYKEFVDNLNKKLKKDINNIGAFSWHNL